MTEEERWELRNPGGALKLLKEGIEEFLRASREHGLDGWGRDWYRCRICNNFVRDPEEEIEHLEHCPYVKLRELVK